MKDRVPIARLLQEALARTGYDAVLLAEFLGQRKLANLQKLIEQARSLRRSRAFSRSTTSSRSFRSSSPGSPTSRWRPRIPRRSTSCG